MKLGDVRVALPKECFSEEVGFCSVPSKVTIVIHNINITPSDAKAIPDEKWRGRDKKTPVKINLEFTAEGHMV